MIDRIRICAGVTVLALPTASFAGGGARVLMTLEPAGLMAPLLGVAAMMVLLAVLALLGIVALRRRPGMASRAALAVGAVGLFGGAATLVEGAGVSITSINGADCTQPTEKSIQALEPIAARNDCDHPVRVTKVELVDCSPNDEENAAPPACTVGDLGSGVVCNLPWCSDD